MNVDLSLVPVKDLQEELVKRFDHIAIIGIKIYPTEKKISRRWNGDHHITAGLCSDIELMILQDWFNRQTPIKTDDL